MRPNQEHLEAVVAFALVALAVFPVLGNAIALLVHIPRRIAQIGTLLVFGAWAAYGWYRLDAHTRVFRVRAARRLTIPFVSAMAVVGVVVGRALATGSRPSLYAVYAAIVAVLWLTSASWVVLHRSPMQRVSGTFGPSQTFSRLVVMLVAGVAMVAYFFGPEPGDAYMAFRGSAIYAGTSAAILTAVAVGLLAGWCRFAALVFALYLSFLATSRAGLFLLIVLCLVVLQPYSVEGKRHDRGSNRLFQGVALLVICAILVVLPASASVYYPYASSRPGLAGARVPSRESMLTDWEALVQRYARVFRLTIGPAPDRPISETLLLESEGKAEARWRLLSTSLTAIGTSPWGHWPQSFDQVTRIECGHYRVCTYPHNLVLEIGYHFGWIPLVLLALGLAVWSMRVIATLPRLSPLPRVAGIAFLGHLGFAQVSGNLVDHSLALVFGLIWIATQAMSMKNAT